MKLKSHVSCFKNRPKHVNFIEGKDLLMNVQCPSQPGNPETPRINLPGLKKYCS